jgi:hypothetical protein
MRFKPGSTPSSSCDFRSEPAEYIGPVRIEFAVSETELESRWFD